MLGASVCGLLLSPSYLHGGPRLVPHAASPGDATTVRYLPPTSYYLQLCVHPLELEQRNNSHRNRREKISSASALCRVYRFELRIATSRIHEHDGKYGQLGPTTAASTIAGDADRVSLPYLRAICLQNRPGPAA